MNEGHDDAMPANGKGGNNSAEQFQPEPQVGQSVAPQPVGAQLAAEDSQESRPALQDPQPAPQASQGIFSSPDLAVNSENLEEIKLTLSEENKSRIASAFAGTDATRKHDQLSEQMAEQDAISGTVLPAGALGNGTGRSNATTSTATGDIRMPSTKRKHSKLPLILLALVVLVGVGVGVWWVVGGKKQEPTAETIGTVNTAIIFDQTAPIPALFGNSYGYINPDDGSQTIGARFMTAERFYGEYAVAKTGADGVVANTLVINRAGEALFTFDGDAAATYYSTENNLWIINGDAYNIEMQKLSPENTKGQYIGNGYLLVTSETEDAAPKAQNNSDSVGGNDDDNDNNGESGSSGGSDDTQNPLLSSGSIYNLDGKQVYNCGAYCSAFTLEADKNVYGVIRVWGQSSKIINLSTGAVIYETPGTLVPQDDGLLEKNAGVTTFLKIQNNQVVKAAQPEAAQTTVSNAGEYVIEFCSDSGKYTIKSIVGRVVSNCDIDEYYELPTNLYLAYQNQFKKPPILVVKNDELQLLNMKDAQVIRTYRGRSAITFEDSPFLHLQNLMNNESVVCNLLIEGDDSCKGLGNESLTFDGYGNYFTTNSGATEHIYNAILKEIR